MELKLRDFESQILYFNGMYKLPIGNGPTIMAVAKDEIAKDIPAGKLPGTEEKINSKDAVIARLKGFKKTISDEVTEVDDIMTSVQLGYRVRDGALVEPRQEYTPKEFLVDMADWLADIQVYCASEMAKFGIPLRETLSIVMSSNFSKLGADGKAIYDKNGKVLKGPGYWKPEPLIAQLLEERVADMADKGEIRPSGIVWG